MGTEFFGELEPSLKDLMAQVRSGGGSDEEVVGCSTSPLGCPQSIEWALPVGPSHSAASGTQASCRGDTHTAVCVDGSARRDEVEGGEAVQSGWKRRHRVGKAPPERALNPSRSTALEKTLREYPTRGNGEVIVPAVGVSFDSIGKAYDFYNLYSWERGFGIRYGKSRLNVDRVKCMQEIVCGCSGRPRATNSQSTTCLCTALIRLLRSKDNGWYICEHRDQHTHDLSASFVERAHWLSHKHIDSYTKDLLKQLRENNVNLGKVYNIIGRFFGKMENVPFMKRTLKTLCGQISRE